MSRTDAVSLAAGAPASRSQWLMRYYGTRAIFSALWVALVFTLGKTQPSVAIALMVVYPAWDCLANYVDAARNGGMRPNPTQTLNVIVSAGITLAVVATVGHDFHATIGVIGVWAALSGILQLATGIRRWQSVSAQWPQILSGALSCLAAAHFILRATNPLVVLGAATVGPYAAFGALFFAISTVVLAFKR